MVGEAQSGWRFCLPCFAVRWTYSLDTVMFVGKQLYVYNILYIYAYMLIYRENCTCHFNILNVDTGGINPG